MATTRAAESGPRNGPGASLGAARRLILVDGHVHLHVCFDAAALLAGAARNFRRLAAQMGASEAIGVLLLADQAGQNSHERLLRAADRDLLGAWSIHRTDEDFSLVACDAGEGRLVLIAGRQIVTAEGLELLALCCPCRVPDGLPMAECLQRVHRGKGLPVIPWGLGKWSLRRGSVVAALIESQGGRLSGNSFELFLGDNGGRAQLLPEPRLFALARAKRMRILPGSDPLPLRSHCRRAGSYGFSLKGTLDLAHPAEHLKQLLRRHRSQPRIVGRLERLAPFCFSQVAMQLRKWQSRVRS